MSFHDDDSASNSSGNPSFSEVLQASRRNLIRGGLGAAGLFFLGCDTPWGEIPLPRGGKGGPTTPQPLLGFRGVPVSSADAIVVPPGYRADVLFAWGDPISAGPAFAQDASNSTADQERQAGMHHDGMHFFSLDELHRGKARGEDKASVSRRGLLVVNHEYTDDGLLHPGGMTPWTASP
jgi:uncharacterized protein